MAKKKFRVTYDAPITLSFIFITAIIFILDQFALKGSLSEKILICSGRTNGYSFDYTSPLSYVRIFAHVFHANNWINMLSNATFLLLLGPVLEERYGSIAIALTLFLSSLISGVLATFSPIPVSGPSAIIFLFILLSTITSFEKRNLSLSSILLFILYSAFVLSQGYGNNLSLFTGNKIIIFFKANIPSFMSLIAGILGSIAGFLTAPKATKSAKQKKTEKSQETTIKSETEIFDEEIKPKKEKRFFGKPQAEEETTIIGSLEI